MRAGTIRPCGPEDLEDVYSVINDGAEAYRGVIPEDCWHEPYMSPDELRREIAAGVSFWGLEENSLLEGVMGIQHVQDVTLIRHAYVRTRSQRRGAGSRLLSALRSQTIRPMLVGTWAAAVWAVRFYEKHGFTMVSPEEKDRLLRTYWTVPERQIETSVVLADRRWSAQTRTTRGG